MAIKRKALIYTAIELLFFVFLQFTVAAIVFFNTIDRSYNFDLGVYVSSASYSTRIFFLSDRIISLQFVAQFFLVYLFLKRNKFNHSYMVVVLVFLSFLHLAIFGGGIYQGQMKAMFLPDNYHSLLDQPGQFPFMYVGYVILLSNFLSWLVVVKRRSVKLKQS